ncbi:MAG: hypothetical protein ACR2KQ_12400 [Actinomycetota bacterium]
MDLSRLTTSHKIGLAGAVGLLISSFLPWYSVSVFSISGWNSGFLAWLGILLGLAAGVILALKAFGKQDVRAGGFAPEQLALALGALSLVFIILRLLTQSSAVAFGLFLGLLSAAAIAYGAYKAMTDAGMSVDDMKDRFGSGGAAGDGPSSPPPTP